MSFAVQDAVHDAWIDVNESHGGDDYIRVKQEMFERIDEVIANNALIKEIGWHIAFNLDINSWEDYKEASEKIDELDDSLLEAKNGLRAALNIVDLLKHHNSDAPATNGGNPIYNHNMKWP